MLFSVRQRLIRLSTVQCIVHVLCRVTLEFTSLGLWPPNSPDLNPVDYKVWRSLQARVRQKRVCDADELKHHIVKLSLMGPSMSEGIDFGLRSKKHHTNIDLL